ncbi:MAG: fucose isomerase [Acidobacteriota bacterium]|jgi:L-fucose isomerase-like protein|nr:fucose isomerase [Acidobacteriota bacterium]NLT34169.1 fucose isomerase [Acidobacteriota bacterium]
MNNIPSINVGIVAVSRDCFPIELSRERRSRVAAACREMRVPITEIETIVENERDVLAALEEIARKRINALVVYLGNFGPEGPETMLVQRFSGPAMIAAAAEESGDNLVHGRGDAYCGLLSASYNLGLRRQRPHIPEYPVGDPREIAVMIAEFLPVARVVEGVRNLKIISFGPRPFDFLTCHAPIQPLFDLGVEIVEHSELDLYDLVQAEDREADVERIAGEIVAELGAGNTYPDLVPKLARYESALEEAMRANLGASRYVAFANKCWPAFQKYFGHVPCYINSRLAARGIPVACEADIYGALSQYMCVCATGRPPGLLDINNSVPRDMVERNRAVTGDYALSDLWMGFHCGNTSSSCLLEPVMKHQLIMHRLQESGRAPDITRGTLEGRIQPGPVSVFRVQSTSGARLGAYVAQGEVLDLDPRSFGSIGVFAVREMGRFYRHVLIERRFPHHTAVAFGHAGKTLFAACRMLGIEDLFYNHPKGLPYPGENPF